jgi:hypothetical protein
MTFVENLVIVPRVPRRNKRIGLQLLDKDINFRVLHPFPVISLELIVYNEGERKKWNLHLHTFLKENQQPKFLFPSC